MSKLSKRHFWEWFRRHQQEYLELNKKPKKEAAYWLSELNAHLRSYLKYFGFSLDLDKEQGPRLTITVNGIAIRFKRAEALVAKAPEIPGWTLVALEDPRPIDFLMEQQIEDTGIDPREFRFSFDNDDPDNATLIVYHPLCTPENERLIIKLAHMAVYNLLGERSFGTDIRWLEVANLSTADPSNLEELEALPEYIGLRKSALIVDSRGNLVSMD